MSDPSTPFTPTSGFVNQLPTPTWSMQADIQDGLIDFTAQFIDNGGDMLNLLQNLNAASDDSELEGMTTTGPAVVDGLHGTTGPVPQQVVETKFPWKIGGCPKCRYNQRGCRGTRRGKKKYPCAGPTYKTIKDWNLMSDTEREALFEEYKKTQ